MAAADAGREHRRRGGGGDMKEGAAGRGAGGAVGRRGGGDRLGEGTAVCPGRHQAAVVDVGAYMILWEAENDKEWLRSPVLINPFFKKNESCNRPIISFAKKRKNLLLNFRSMHFNFRSLKSIK